MSGNGNTQFIGSPSQPERIKAETLVYEAVTKAIMRRLRVAMPAQIVSFDATKQTVVVSIMIRESIILNNDQQNQVIPDLLDVPIVTLRAGGFAITPPIQVGDECLVVFADMCYNAWFTKSGYQNQERIRRHSLSDAFAIIGCWNQKRNLSDYSTNSLQIRSDDGSVLIDVKSNEIDITAPTVKVTSTTGNVEINGGNVVNINGSNQVNISGSGNTNIEGKDFLHHMHSGVQSGGSDTGPVI